MRTLVISDLHLGSRSGHDVLRRPVPRTRLLNALEGIDRLVLLGDVLELMSRNRRRSLAVAEPVLRALGERLGPERDVILVPGNHDEPLARAWALAQGRRLGTATAVAGDASPILGRLLAWLAPARARASYPGVWLADGVWATHGQYLDRHLRPHGTVGVQYGRLAAVPRGGTRPIEYERARRRPRRIRDPLPVRLLSRPVGTVVEELVGMAIPSVPRLLKQGGMAPVTARLLDVQMRHSAVPAMARVVRRLGVDADWVLFGHVHRRGPLHGERWPSDGGTRFVNTGCWVYEPLLLDRARPPHPYWPGGAILLEDGRPPRSLGLLDDLAAEELRSLPSAPAPGTR